MVGVARSRELDSRAVDAEPRVPGHPGREGGGQERDVQVVVVVDLGDRLARGRAQDASCALDQQPVASDGGGEEQRVQRRCVETLADEGRRAEHRHSVAGLGFGESLDDGTAFSCRHSSLEHERIVSEFGEQCDEGFKVGDTAGQDQTVPSTSEGVADVGDHLGVPGAVDGQRPVRIGDR